MITNLVLATVGVIAGIVFGAIPGMTATMAVAVFLPMTYAYDLVPALYLLLGLYIGGISGGLVPAILINIPGTPSSITTTFDGYPMAKRGEGERALKTGIVASFIGGLLSLIALALFTPMLSAAVPDYSVCTYGNRCTFEWADASRYFLWIFRCTDFFNRNVQRKQ